MPVELVSFMDGELGLHDSNAHVTPLDNLSLLVKEKLG